SSQPIDLPEVRPSDFNTPPGSLSMSAFLNWAPTNQADYVRAHGTGTPPSVRIGPAGSQQIIATVSGFAVDVVNLPSGFDTAPATLSANDFLDWTTNQQLAYLRANGGGPLTIGPNASPHIAATIATGGATVDITFLPPAPNIPPSALSAAEFL